MKRLIAILLVLVLGGSIFLAVNSGSGGRRTDGLYYAAAGIHPDAELLQVNGDAVTAEEYLYWLAYDCEYLTSYNGALDWNEQVTDDMTYSQYAKADALETVKLYAVVRQWAEQNEITLTEDDQAQLEALRQQYVTYYGGEEGYTQQIQLLGIGQEAFDAINTTSLLYSKVMDAYCSPDGALYPGDEAVDAFAADGGYLTVKLLHISTAGLDNQDAIDAQYAKAEDCVRRLREAEDPAAVYDALVEELALTYDENGLTICPTDADVDETLYAALNALAVGEISDVITCENGYYVGLRTELDRQGVIGDCFQAALQQAQEDAQVKRNDKLYDAIDAETFYTALLQERSALQQQFAAAADDTSDSGETAEGGENAAAGSGEAAAGNGENAGNDAPESGSADASTP